MLISLPCYFQADLGEYSCVANNTEGATIATVDIKGDQQDIAFL